MMSAQDNSNINEHTIENKGISVTENAIKRILTLAESEKRNDAMLRIVVEGGGCSGFQYKYEFPVYEINEKKDSGDITFMNQEGRIVLLIDPISAGFMKDSVVDFVETLGSSIFEIRNPNTTARCGCGNSFNV